MEVDEPSAFTCQVSVMTVMLDICVLSSQESVSDIGIVFLGGQNSLKFKLLILMPINSFFFETFNVMPINSSFLGQLF